MQKRKRINKINKKHTVEFENNSFLPELYGNHDQNLAKFENYYGVSISYRGNILEISGDDESSLMAADKIMQLYNELDNGIKLGIKGIDVFLKSKKIEKDQFLIKTTPQLNPIPFQSFPWQPQVHLGLFVHRVNDLR